MLFNLFRSRSPDLRSALFVCTANVTRSPVAEAMFRKAIAATGEEWLVDSAGVRATGGSMPNPVISFVMSTRGLPISSHRSQPVTKRLLKRFHWIIVMEISHRDAILKMDPKLEGRIFTFRELGGGSADPRDMPDPTGKNEEDFRDLFNILDAEMPTLVKTLRNKVDDLLSSGEEE